MSRSVPGGPHRPWRARIASGVLVVCGLLQAEPARAVLGGDVASIQADALRLRSERRATAGPGYSVHAMTSADGSTVREYADAQGQVFMVSWHTRRKPIMAELLGAFHADYRRAASRALATPGLKRQAHLAEGDLVVESSVHLNAWVGRAWLRSRTPAGLDAAAVR